MIKTFILSLDKKNSIKSLIKKTNKYFMGSSCVTSRVIAPKDKNFVIYIGNKNLEISVVEDEEYNNTLNLFTNYLETNFENQVIGMYGDIGDGSNTFKNSNKLKFVYL